MAPLFMKLVKVAKNLVFASTKLKAGLMSVQHLSTWLNTCFDFFEGFCSPTATPNLCTQNIALRSDKKRVNYTKLNDKAFFDFIDSKLRVAAAQYRSLKKPRRVHEVR